MHNLGVLLSTQETPQDYQEAAGWFTTAATAGLTDSQFNLALLYERGLGVQQNSGKAYFWYQVASLAGDKEATRHAERVQHGLPEAETQAADGQAAPGVQLWSDCLAWPAPATLAVKPALSSIACPRLRRISPHHIRLRMRSGERDRRRGPSYPQTWRCDAIYQRT